MALSINAYAAETFRVMTYNIHHGEGLDHKVDLPRIAALIKKEKADIVALQEVDKGVKRTAGRDLTAEMAKLTGMTGVFSNNFHFQGGEYGNAILTRFPVLKRTNLHYQMLYTNEQRGALQVTLDVHGRHLYFVDTHVDFRPGDAERLKNVGELAQLVTAHRELPIIICGDFNSTPKSSTHQAMAAILDDAWLLASKDAGYSFPADKPDRRIDYQWVSHATITPVRAWVPDTEASDHRPVMVEFELK
ncbi:MAG: Endonuclease/Exonuclease/phosphatase family protein [Verrucomicrobiales bacterium]|nr:Endonuclease/Exonuclease/phosphatase family protein [Verrucomicrobiales bacterium]